MNSIIFEILRDWKGKNYQENTFSKKKNYGLINSTAHMTQMLKFFVQYATNKYLAYINYKLWIYQYMRLQSNNFTQCCLWEQTSSICKKLHKMEGFLTILMISSFITLHWSPSIAHSNILSRAQNESKNIPKKSSEYKYTDTHKVPWRYFYLVPSCNPISSNDAVKNLTRRHDLNHIMYLSIMVSYIL